MRVLKADLIYALTRQPLSSLTSLHLDGLKVETLSLGLVQIPNLLVLRVNDNNIRSIVDIELEGNEMLWEVHARGNAMESVSLSGRRAMGVLDLGRNKLTEEELGRALGGMTVISLSVSHNPAIEGSSAPDSPSSVPYRRRVLEKVPGAWVLDGHFVSKEERVGLGGLRPQNDDETTEPVPGSPCAMFISQVFDVAPTKNQDSVDVFR